MRRVVLTVCVFIAAALPLGGAATAGPADDDAVRGSYIVVLKAGDPGQVAAEHRRDHNAAVQYVYRHALRGYSARMSPQAAATVARDPRVEYVEADAPVWLAHHCDRIPHAGHCQPSDPEPEPSPSPSPEPEPDPTPSTQVTPWGVDAVGSSAKTGAGVHVYVIDTGIDNRHPDLNVLGGYAVETCKGGGCQSAHDDDHGHGTHVAGTIGAKDNNIGVIGVAPGVNFWSVKVLAKNGMGTRSGVIAGVDWVAGHNTGAPRVANMSLGGSGSKTGTCTSGGFSGTDTYHRAICSAARTGVVFAVAAGNSGANAAGAVPAAYDDAVLTVSATNALKNWASWSNWGDRTVSGIPTASAPVALAAPGVSILSTQLGGGTTTMSGTSMAAPHVAGAIAVWLQGRSQSASYSAFTNARADLTGKAQTTWDGSKYANGWSNTTGNPHRERFLQLAGL